MSAFLQFTNKRQIISPLGSVSQVPEFNKVDELGLLNPNRHGDRPVLSVIASSAFNAITSGSKKEILSMV